MNDTINPARRRFTLADGMIFIAATAVAMPLYQAHLSLSEYHIGDGSAYWTAIWFQVTGIGAFLLTWSLALFILQIPSVLRHPRRYSLTPGFASSCSVAVGAILAFLRSLAQYYLRDAPKYGWPSVRAFLVYSEFGLKILPYIGVAIASTWVMILIGGRWRKNKKHDWHEQLGRIFGWMWLFLAAIVISGAHQGW